jgi:hypothetical protein
MPHESDSSRANPHNAVALTQLIRRVNNAVACRSRPRPRTGCDNRAAARRTPSSRTKFLAEKYPRIGTIPAKTPSNRSISAGRPTSEPKLHSRIGR